MTGDFKPICLLLVEKKYRQALRRARARCSYGRIMFLGSAAVGKTSLRHGLMNLPLPDKANSTILAETRPVKYEWAMTGGLSGRQWAEVSEEDEIAEEIRIVSNLTLNQSDNEPAQESHGIVPLHTEVDEHKEKVLQASRQSQPNPDQEVSSANPDQEVLLHLWDCGGQLVFFRCSSSISEFSHNVFASV